MTLDRATEIADIIAPLVATVAVIAALFVYVRQTAQKRTVLHFTTGRPLGMRVSKKSVICWNWKLL